MLIDGKELNTIEEVMALMTEEQQAHSKRVALYMEAAFVRAANKGVYYEELKGSNEIVIENKEYAYLAGLYHDIGKVLSKEENSDGTQTVDPENRTDHGALGAKIVEELYPDYKKLKSYHQRMITEGALDHHEYYDGSGKPEGKSVRKIGYMGRMAAIADEIDHRAMNQKSEDPIGDTLKEIKKEADSGKFDPEFLKCFTLSATSIRKAFNNNNTSSKAIPVAETWIKRRESRPMELRYRHAVDRSTKERVFVAEMRFRATKGEFTDYDDMKKLIVAKKMGPSLGDYFLYELLDALKRFELCKVGVEKAIILLPEAWYTQPKLAGEIKQIFRDEDEKLERVRFQIPDSLMKKPSKTFTKNLEECKELGVQFITAETVSEIIDLISEEMLHEDEIAQAAIDGQPLPKIPRVKKPKPEQEAIE